MNNNYKIVRTIFENVFQRVLECKNNDTGDIFYSNIITSQKVINLINLDELKKIPSNILECYNTEDRIYIYTKPFNMEYKGLRENLNNQLTLKQQFSLSESVIDLSQSIFNMTDVVQQKILDIDKLYVDSDNKVHVNCNLIFEQEYDIADNETFKRLGNMIHFIFSGSEIVDYNISDSIPPDILKIIVRCLTKEYIFPIDVLTEMKNSPIYAMIFGVDLKDKVLANEKEEVKYDDVKLDSQVKENIKTSYEDIVEESNVDEDSPILDIYVNDNNPTPTPEKNKINSKLFAKKDIVRAAVSILVVVMVLLVGNKLVKSFNKTTEANSDNVQENNEGKNSSEHLPPTAENPDVETETDGSDIADSTEMYFNEELLNNVGYNGNKAAVDSNIYVEGKNSLVVSNDVDEKVKSLFAVVDFKDEKFNYMLKKQISIAAKLKSETDVTAQIVLEAYRDGALTSNFHTTPTQIYNDIWSPFTVPINVTDADSLKIYIEYKGKNKVWIDSIYIDVIK